MLLVWGLSVDAQSSGVTEEASSAVQLGCRSK